MVIFKKLTIRNIAAIAEADIDFRCPELINEEIFLIDGKNGAGKSTILDCICLALYATTARLHDNKEKSKDEKYKIDGVSSKDPKSLLRRGTTKGEVTLSFIGKDGVNYVASYTIEKTRNNTFKNNKPWKLLNEDTQKTEESVKTIESIISKTAIGQNFDDFRKTVLIPQGQCAELVKESADERGKLLAKLVDCSKFEKVGIKIYTTTDDIGKEYQKIVSKIGDIKCPTAEDIQKKEEDILAKTDEIADKKNEKEPLAVIENAYSARQDAEKEIADINEKIESAKKEYATLVGGIKFLRSKIKKDKIELANLKTFIASEESNATMYSQVQTIIGLINTYQDLLNKANDKILDAEKLKEERESLLTAEATDKSELEAIVEEDSKCNKEIDSINAQLKDLDAESVKKEVEGLNSRITSIKNLRDNTLPVLDTLKKSKEAASEEVNSTKSEIEKTRVTLSERVEAENAAKIAYDNAEEEYNQKYICTEDIVNNLRSIITEKKSEYCPVCGQKILGALQVDVVDNMIADLDSKRKEAKRFFDAAVLAVKEVNTTLTTHETSIKTKIKKESNAVSSYDERYKKFVLECKALSINPDSSDISMDISNEICLCENRLKEVQGTLDTIKTLEQKRSELNEKHIGLLKKSNTANEKYTKSSLAVNNNKKSIETAQNEADSFKTESELKYAEARGKITLANWDDLWNEDHSEAVKTLSNAADLYSQKVNDRTKIESSLAPDNQTIETIDEIKASVSDLFPEWNIDDNSVVENEIANCKSRWINHQRDVSTLKSGLDHQKEIIRKAKDVIDNYESSSTDNSRETLKLKIQEIETMIENNNKAIGALRTEVQNDKDIKNKYENLVKEKEIKELEYNKWQTLCEKFGDAQGKKFRDIALCFIFGGIVEKANQIMRNIAPRYKLIPMPGTLELRIYDNDCSALLSLNGLSGGESFVASLSLALALATMKSKDNSCDHLFIDEGFGSLDGDYLTLVMNTLHNLHTFTGGKKVGIISHVQAMSDNIPVHIQVEKHKVKVVTR